MNLSTKYLGLILKNPLVPSASPLSENIDNIKRMEDAGASAVVLHSLFEEQLRLEQRELHHHMTEHSESYAEALTYFPEPAEYCVGPEEYLNHIRKAKKSVNIPVIASLNGSAPGKWTAYAKDMEAAGADALELNIYYIPTDMNLTAQSIEQTYFDILSEVKSYVKIPVAIKLSPFFSSLANMAKKLDDAGVSGLLLFNRFYQPDIELENLEVKSDILLSTPQSLRLPLRWISILYGRLNADLAATGGIHRPEDALKMIMAGASVTMLCSVLLKRGISFLSEIEKGMIAWMTEHEYESIDQMKGSMSQQHCENPAAFERAQYIRALQSFKPPK